MREDLSLQERYAPGNRCFGCGPSNDRGLRIRSFAKENGEVEMRFRPLAHHLAFEGILNGGIIGTLLDCHCNWAAAYYLMLSKGLEIPPCTVTASYSITLKRVTPIDAELLVLARVVKIDGDRAEIDGEIIVDDKITATCKGVFVAVREGHPAYHRW
jgi:acyl-coenzyme A thioesterase PaaI-like protein